MIRALDLQLKGLGFNSRFQLTTRGKLFSTITKQYNLVLVEMQWHPMADKVTVGLASQWPCNRDVRAYSPKGLRPEKEIYSEHSTQCVDSNTTGIAREGLPLCLFSNISTHHGHYERYQLNSLNSRHNHTVHLTKLEMQQIRPSQQLGPWTTLPKFGIGKAEFVVQWKQEY